MSKLIVKTTFGFAFLMFVLALALFVSAGTLRFWQAQVYLADFALCTLLITVYLIKYDQELLAGRVKAGPVAETQQGQKKIQSLASLFFIGLFIVPGLDFRFGWSNVTPVFSLIAVGVQRKQLYQSYHRSISRAKGHYKRTVSRGSAPDVCRGGCFTHLYAHCIGVMGSCPARHHDHIGHFSEVA
jgi:hypothetical protein